MGSIPRFFQHTMHTWCKSASSSYFTWPRQILDLKRKQHWAKCFLIQHQSVLIDKAAIEVTRHTCFRIYRAMWLLLILAPTLQVLDDRNSPTPRYDPFHFLVSIVDFLMLGMCRYQCEVSLFQDLPLLPSF